MCLECVGVCLSVLDFVGVSCSVLQCVSVCFSVLQCVAHTPLWCSRSWCRSSCVRAYVCVCVCVKESMCM